MTESGLLSFYYRRIQAEQPINLDQLLLKALHMNEICGIVEALT